MRKLFIAIVALLGLVPLAFSQSIQLGPGQLLGNDTAASRPARATTIGALSCPAADNTFTTDATAALQACAATGFLDLASRGGTYKITSQINISSNLLAQLGSATIRQVTRGARIFYGANVSNIVMNDGVLYGEGTFCGNVGQGVTAACPLGQWGGDGGLDGFNGRGIQLDNCTNCRLSRLRTKNNGTAGIYLFGGNGIWIDQPFIEGTNLYTTPVTGQGNFEYGIGLSDGDGFGSPAINNLFINGATITGTAQAYSFGNAGVSTAGLVRQINGSKVYGITGQHAYYGATGSVIINGFSCATVTDACIKNQIQAGAFSDPYNFTAVGVSADTVGSNLFEVTVIGGVGQHNINLQGVCKGCNRGLSTSGPVTNLTASLQVQDTISEAVFITGDAAKDFDIDLQSVRSGGDGILVTATNADRIRFHHPIVRQPSTAGAGRWAALISSASANVTFTDPVFVDASGLMLNGLANLTAGSTVKVFGSAAITGASGTCVSATGTVTAWPIWTTLACTGGNYTGAANISRGALGDASVPFTSLFMGGTTTTVLHGNASGASAYGAIVSADMNITATNCTNQFVSAISTGGVGSCSTVALTSLATQNANTIVGNAAAGVAVPTALPISTCSGATNALQWVLNSGFLCNNSITAAAVPVGGITGLGTGVAAALALNIGSAGAPVTFNGAGGTPSSIVLTNATGTAPGLTAGTASAVAVGGITGLGTGVATALGINVGSAGAFVTFNGAGGTPASLTLTNANGLPISGITGFGTGVATALAVNVGTAGAFVVNGGALGTPSSGTATNLSGTAAGLTAGAATNVGVTDDNSTNATMNLAWFTSNTGNLPAKTSSGKLVFNPSTGTLSATTFNGAGTSLTGTAASLTAGTANAVTASAVLSTMDARGTWTTGTSWTLPAHTWAGTVSGGGNQLNNTVLGAVTPLAATVTTLGSGAHTITSASATAFTVGPNGATNPALLIDASTASAATGIQIVSKAAGGGLNITTISSATNEDILFNAKGSGLTYFASASTGTADFNLGGGNANFRHDVTVVGQIFQPNVTSQSTAASGSICWTTGTGKYTVDTTLACLTSSARFKNIVGEVPSLTSLDIVERLRTISFTRKKEFGGDKDSAEQFGFTAEQAASVDERLISRGPDGEPLGVRYMEFTAVLAGAIQQLNSRITSLENRK